MVCCLLYGWVEHKRPSKCSPDCPHRALGPSPFGSWDCLICSMIQHAKRPTQNKYGPHAVSSSSPVIYIIATRLWGLRPLGFCGLWSVMAPPPHAKPSQIQNKTANNLRAHFSVGGKLLFFNAGQNGRGYGNCTFFVFGCTFPTRMPGTGLQKISCSVQ